MSVERLILYHTIDNLSLYDIIC